MRSPLPSDSFQAWSFLLDWPVWPQDAFSHLGKTRRCFSDVADGCEAVFQSRRFYPTQKNFFFQLLLPFLATHQIFQKKMVFEIGGYATLQNRTILVHSRDAYINFQLGYLWVLNTAGMILKRRPVCKNWWAVWLYWQ